MSIVVVMAKEPRPGHVKTRLVPPLTPREAADLAGAFLEDLHARLSGMPGVTIRIALPSGDSPERMARWLGSGAHFTDQGEGDLGARLTRVTADAFARDDGPVLVLGSDHPDVPRALLRRALDAAARGQAGWVPTEDGGYACLALPGPTPELFRDIPWSTPDVARETRNRAASIGVSLEDCGSWYDVDDAADVGRLLRDPDAPRRCPRTIALLRGLSPAWFEREGADEATTS